MSKINGDFKLAKLKTLKDIKFKFDEDRFIFNIYGNDEKNNYSLQFISKISLEEMKKYKNNEHINFIDNIYANDVIFGVNGIYNLDVNILQADVIKYLDKKFLLKLLLKTSDNYVLELEIDF